MSSQNSLNGEIREQMKKMKDMSLKGKISHLWTYYKIHAAIIIIAIVFISSLIYDYATHKDTVLYTIFVNASMPYMDGSALSSEFEQFAGIDTNKYETYFDFSFRISDVDSTLETAYTNEKFVAMMYARTVDAMVADSATFDYYAQNDYFANLENVLSKEVLEKYKDYLYYIDMEKTIPVGIILPEGSSILEAGCYDYLTEKGITYQGNPSKAILGIFEYSQNIDMIMKLLEF